MKLALVVAFIVVATAADAQQRTVYDARGHVVGRTATDSQGSTTIYDQGGRVVGRSSTTGTTTNVYDAGGRNVARITGTSR